MRTPLLVVLLLAPLAAAALPAPVAVMAVGPVTTDAGCDAVAKVAIETPTRAVADWPAYGTGVVDLTGDCWLLHADVWVGGQSFEWASGNCRILADASAECWHGFGWEWEAPDWEDAEGGVSFLRLAPDGAFHMRVFDLEARGILART